MTDTREPSNSRATRWVGIAAIAAGVAGAAYYFGADRALTPGPDALESVVLNSDAPASDAATETATSDIAAAAQDAQSDNMADTTAQAAPEDASADEASDEDAAPTFDEVRQEADGLTVIAGRAAPGSTVTVMVDGVEAAKAVADGRGAFAAVGFVTPSKNGSVLTLRQGEGDAATASAEEIILAPLPEAPTEATQAQDTATAEPAEGTEEEIVVAAQTPSAAAPAEAEAATKPQTQDEASVGALDKAVTASDPLEGQEDTAETSEAATDQPGQATSLAAPSPSSPAEAPDTASASNTSEALEEPVAEAEAGPPPAELQTEAQTELALAAPEPAPLTGTGVVQPQASAGGSTTPDLPASTGTETAPQRQRVAVLKSTEDGVELLQALPEIESVALDTIGYSDRGDVQLSGRAKVGAAQVRIYLNNQPAAAMDVDPDGRWRGEVPGVAPGVYTLRVDELNALGVVTSRVETPFKREDVAVLAEATESTGGPVRAITVQRGDTLWAIARERYGEGLLYVQVFEANRDAIRNPDLIYPGQVFDLPE